MKKVYLFSILIILQVRVFGQTIKEGVYEIRKPRVVVCLCKDTLLYYRQSDVTTIYYGHASLVDGKLSMGDNLALGINTRVDTCRIDSGYVEIELNELYKDFMLGKRTPDTALYHIKSHLFTLRFNDKVKTIDDTIAKLSIQDFYPSVGEITMAITGGGFSGYQDEVTLPIKAGIKYTLTQKYYRCQPVLYGMKPLLGIDKKKKKLFLEYYDLSKSRWVKMKYKRECKSCYEELQKLLLENFVF